MTLEEIAVIEGTSKQMVWHILRSGLRKLQQRPHAMQHFEELAKIAAERRARATTWADLEAE